MRLESTIAQINQPTTDVFEFLTKVENYEKIMPKNIQKFAVTGSESFIFQLKGMPEIALKIKEKTPQEKIVLSADGGKIPFGLTAEIKTNTDNTTSVQLFFAGEFNAMMAMMVKKPIQNFINTLSGNMESI